MKALTLRLFPLLICALFLLAGCTVIRDSNNGSGGGDGDGELEIVPRTIDVLVLVDLPRASANLMENYASFLAMLEAALVLQQVDVRRSALAPLYRTQSERPPLLYGHGDEYSPFSGLAETLAFYITDEGLSYLDGTRNQDGENLAALGLNLDRETIFNPFLTIPEAAPYFAEAADGFVVFYLTGSARRCGHSSPTCQIDDRLPAHYFTDVEDDTGFASWLKLPGQTGLPPSRIMHVSIATAEGVDYDTFVNQCLREPNFPAAFLDVIENSEHSYFGPFFQALRSEGGQAQEVDLCAALSSRGDRTAAFTAGQILRMLQ